MARTAFASGCCSEKDLTISYDSCIIVSMARKPAREIRITKLASTIWCIRKQHRMSQVAFAASIDITPSQISRYESGHTKPELKTLLSLLSMADAPAERRPILQELKRQGIGDLLRSIRLSGLLSQQSPMNTVCDGHPAGAMLDAAVSSDPTQQVTP